jgi:Gpi18-like mannosyltransferase
MGLSPWKSIVCTPSPCSRSGPSTFSSFDIFPAALSLFAVLRFAADDAIGAGILLALAVMTKVYPLLLAPMFVLLAWRQNPRA